MTLSHSIVAGARSWIGTRFHHQGRLKKADGHKGGVDCLGLLVGVAAELHITKNHCQLAAADETDYSHQPDAVRLRKRLAGLLREISKGEMAAGDVVLLNVDDRPQHLAIISDMADGLGMIHAYAPAKCVVEHGLDDWWKSRIVAVFRII